MTKFIIRIVLLIQCFFKRPAVSDAFVWMTVAELESLLAEKKELNEKILLWYNMYHGENFAKFFNLKEPNGI